MEGRGLISYIYTITYCGIGLPHPSAPHTCARTHTHTHTHTHTVHMKLISLSQHQRVRNKLWWQVLQLIRFMSSESWWYRRSGDFHCKNIFVVRLNHEKIIFYNKWSVHICTRFSQRQPHLWYPQVTLGKCMTTFRLVSICPINCLSFLPQYVPIAFFASLCHTCSLPTAMWYPQTQQTVGTPRLHNFNVHVPEHWSLGMRLHVHISWRA